MIIYKVHLVTHNITLEHNNQLSLLENLEKHGIFHEYQCRMGYCGACRVTLLQGKVSYPQPPLAFVAANQALLCCCKLESDIEIEF